MTRKNIYHSTDATYVEKLREFRKVVYAWRMLTGQRPIGDEYDRILYKNISDVIDSIAKLTRDHDKYRKPVPSSRRGNGGIRGSAARIKKRLEVNH